MLRLFKNFPRDPVLWVPDPISVREKFRRFVFGPRTSVETTPFRYVCIILYRNIHAVQTPDKLMDRDPNYHGRGVRSVTSVPRRLRPRGECGVRLAPDRDRRTQKDWGGGGGGY